MSAVFRRFMRICNSTQSRTIIIYCSQCMKFRTQAVVLSHQHTFHKDKITKSTGNACFANSIMKRFSSIDALSANSSLIEEQHHRLQLPNTFRSASNNPADHTAEDIGLFYTIPKEEFEVFSPKTIKSKAFQKRCLEEFHAFNESSIMIRQPSLEIINYMKHTDYSLPVQRYLIYGDLGTGKSYALQHVVHYCVKSGWLIVPIFQAWDFMLHRSKHRQTQLEEILESQWNKDRFDQPEPAVAWLEVFRHMNKQHLTHIKTTREYVWSKREKTDAGTPLSTLIDLGIARTRIATDVIGCIMREIRIQGPETMPRTLVAIDNVNALFAETKLRARLKGKVDADELTLVINLKKLMSNTWTNGAIVCATGGSFTTDTSKHALEIRDAENTYKILGHDGFDLLDPHIPVQVENYTLRETLSQLAYYEDRKWLTDRAMTDEGRQEIIQLACNNPVELVKVCNTLN